MTIVTCPTSWRSRALSPRTRFKMAELDPPQNSSYRYMALYEVEAEDLAKANQALMNTAGTDAMVLSEALDQNASAIYFEPITERVVPT